MENKSIIITTGEFRKDIRKYLDMVVNGRVVIIDRFGQRFIVSYLPKEVDFIIGLQDDGVNQDLNGVNPNQFLRKDKKV